MGHFEVLQGEFHHRVSAGQRGDRRKHHVCLRGLGRVRVQRGGGNELAERLATAQ